MDQLQLSPPPAATDLPWKRTKIRVPRNDGGLLAMPDLHEVPDTVALNRERLSRAECRILGRSLQTLREQAREQSLRAAEQFTSRMLGREIAVSNDGPLIATGHQPELFHPGVWVKQFAVTQLARRTTGIGLNLIVDSDMVRSHQVRVPAGNRETPTIEFVPFDSTSTAGPWQDIPIQCQQCFAAFGSRVNEALSRWGVSPLARELWPHAVAHASSGAGLADCLSAGRINTEWNWGEGNLELPLSTLCGTEAFLWFAVDLLSRADEFRETYNAALNGYRSINRIRSESHPVPELGVSAGWIEVPFMVWQSGDAQRRHVFVRRVEHELQLASGPDETAVFARLPFGSDGDPSDAVAELRRVQQSGCRFRTRALTTTLFMRLCLTDLFVHGIGGAKYDEMTDRIISHFYGIQPPEFLTLSATVWLPLAEPSSDTTADVSRIHSMLRELRHNPQRYVARGQSDVVDALLDEKQQLIREQQQSNQQVAATGRPHTYTGLKRYRRFPEINRALTSHTQEQQRHLNEELANVERRLQANSILTGREYSFCLYPAERIHRMIAETHAACDG